MKSTHKKTTWLGVAALALTCSFSALAADAAAGKAKAALCVACHGPDGKGIDPPPANVPVSPRIAGQFEGYLAKAIKEYKGKVRAEPTMGAIAAGLSDDDVANLAAYFSSVK